MARSKGDRSISKWDFGMSLREMPEGAKKIPQLDSDEKVGFGMIIGEGRVYDIQKVLAGYPLK